MYIKRLQVLSALCGSVLYKVPSDSSLDIWHLLIENVA